MGPWLTLLAALLVVSPAAAGSQPDPAAALVVSQGALGKVLPDLSFVDTAGHRVRLSDYQGRPLLISMIYTGCADICPTLIESLRPSVAAAQEALGEDSFYVVTVGFDGRNDTPDRLRSFAQLHGADLPNWSFLSTDQKTLDRLAEAVGFTFLALAGGFEHMAQVSFVDQKGELYQNVYGGTFEPPAIVEPLKDLVLGQRHPLTSLDGITDRIRLFCTIYNPRTGRYYFNYSLFVGFVIGAGCLLLVLTVLVREQRRGSAREKEQT
jgi:protein SCO1/2